MIECKFTYNKDMLNKIRNNSIKRVNFITEVCMFIILLSSIVLFCVKEVQMGVIFLVLFGAIAIGLIVSNVTILKGNNVLLGQTVEVGFEGEHMTVKNSLGDSQLSSAKIDYSVIKQVKLIDGLVYFYVNKTSAIIVPKNSFVTEQDFQKAVALAGNNYVV